MKTKNFIYTVENNKGKCDTSIYVIENNKPTYLGSINYNLGACRGHESEVFNFLLDDGQLSVQDTKLLNNQKGTLYYENVYLDGVKILNVRDKYKLYEL